MTPPSIKQLLRELYEIDPALRAQEKQLIPLIEALLKHNPGHKPDERFVQQLRLQLQKRADALSGVEIPLYRDALSGVSTSPFFFMNKFLYAGAGALVALIIAIPAVLQLRSSPGTPAPGESAAPLFTYGITPTPEKAFGTLQGDDAGVSSLSRNQSGGGGPGVGGGGMAIATDSVAKEDAARIMPVGDFTVFRYTYDGELPALPEKTVSVLRRQKGLSRPSLASVLDSFPMSNLNLASFDGSVVDSITFNQEREFGYMVSLFLKEGVMSISQNWEKWPHPEANCRDEKCYQSFRLSISDIPADDEVIGIAKAFIASHKIDVSRYGAPEVDTQWKRDYERISDKSQAYIPDTVQVLYPLLVEDQPVYEQGGVKSGIRVGVHVRTKRVSDVSGLMNLRYESSEYDAVDSADAIKEYLKAIEGFPGEYYPQGTNAKEVTVTLGAPTQGYSVYYNFQNNMQEELLVPSLIFPVEKSEGEQPWRSAVVVPLAKELMTNNRGGPILY